MVKGLKIKSIKAREILDSRGRSTVEAGLITDYGVFKASVPSGVSRGKYEAVALRASKAVENINRIIAVALKGKNPTRQKEIDELMIKLDGTKNKKKLGVNAILAVSLAVCRAGAEAKNLPLWKYISQLAKIKPKLPKPSILLIEGGLHGKSRLPLQEFMVIPQGKSFRERFQAGKKIYYNLKKCLKKNFGNQGIKMGYEGALTPPISDIKKALDFIIKAAQNYKIEIGLDCAASHFKKGKYKVNFYQSLVKEYPIIFLEDPFGEEDWQGWKEISNFQFPISNFLIIGDDLLVTNLKRLKEAKKKKACNGVIIKPNQVGTVDEVIGAVKLAKSFGWKIMVSHRAGETLDDFISDLAVGVAADFIKAGAPSRPERVAKYNRLLKIEKEFLS